MATPLIGAPSVQTPVLYYYDQYGRSTGQTDPQTGRTAITEYNAQGQVDRTVDLAGNSTFYEYHATGNGAGQLKKVTHQDGAYTSYVYDAQGRVTEQTGSADYPVRYTYDATDGWMTEMKTYRDTTGNDALTGTAANASLTTWAYDAATGLLTSKTDAAGKATSYNYWTGTTLLKERLWARFVSGTTRVTTSYDYDATGQLISTTYNDGTPSVTRPYDRAGREATRADAAGLTTITRTAGGFATAAAISGSGPLSGWTLTRAVDAQGRLSGIDGIWSAAGLAANNGIVTAAYGYDSATGRLATVTNNARSVALTYTANSDQPYKRQFKDNANTVLSEQEYGYDEAGRLNAAITRDVSPATVHAAYYYQYDNRNRRTQAIREDGVIWNYGYDSRGQVTSAKMKTGADFLAGRQYEYAYDAIGNRTTAKSGGNPAGTGLRTTSYTRNNLNQYTAVINPQTFDVNGLDTNPNDVWVMTDPAYPYAPDSIQPATTGVTGRWRKEMTAASSDNSKAMWETVTVKEYTIVKNSGTVRLPPINQAPVYDADGNLTADGTWTYTWDAENRLVQMEMASLPQGTGAPPVLQRITFTYDGLSRRIAKQVSAYDGTQWSALGQWLYTWDGWNCVLRYNDFSVIQWDHGYIWGPDLSGSFQGAGGVGGLLVENKNLGSNQIARRLVGYDGNGNVTTLADGSNGQLWALYEYDAFGNETRHHNAVGSHADDNPFRFSTKPTDTETGLVYYGYRYLSPALGRWISRDPIGEQGGRALYAAMFNSLIRLIDNKGAEPRQVDMWAGRLGELVRPKRPLTLPDKNAEILSLPADFYENNPDNNCCNYAADIPALCYSQEHADKYPGQTGPDHKGFYSCEELMRGLERDGAVRLPFGRCCPQGYHRVRVWWVGSYSLPHNRLGPMIFPLIPAFPRPRVVYPPNFHFYRDDGNGLWSHKEGEEDPVPVTNPAVYVLSERGCTIEHEWCGDVCMPNGRRPAERSLKVPFLDPWK